MFSCEQRQTFMLPGLKPMRNILLSSAVQRGADSDARGQINYPKQPFPLLVSDRREKSGPLGVERASFQPKQPLCTFLPERCFHLHLFLPGWCCFNPPFRLFPLALSPIFPIFIPTHMCNLAQFVFAPVLTQRTAEWIIIYSYQHG